jgi:hypothetical protein
MILAAPHLLTQMKDVIPIKKHVQNLLIAVQRQNTAAELQPILDIYVSQLVRVMACMLLLKRIAALV